jgi:hypothetical protein
MMPVLKIGVILILDVNTRRLLVMTTVNVPKILVTKIPDVVTPRKIMMMVMLVPMMVVMTILEYGILL